MVVEMPPGMQFSVSPRRALCDEVVFIRLAGLKGSETAMITATLVDDFDRTWKSHASFQADRSGVVDVWSQDPVSGTYEGADAMGLFWSMVPSDGHMVNGLIKKGISPATINLTARSSNGLTTRIELERLFIAEGVTRTPVRSNGLVGTLFLPPGRGPFPGVLVFTGSGGGIDEGRGALLASHGFAAFSLAYFNADGLPDSLIDIPLEYFEAGLRWMTFHDSVDGARIGVTGQSRGGELVLLLASIFPSIKAVVAGVPSALVWGGFGKGSDVMEPPPVAWIHAGKPVPGMPGARGKEEQASTASGEPIALTPGFQKAMEDRTAAEFASIPVERSQAAIMLVSGEGDAMWPSSTFADMVEERLHRVKYAHPVVNLKYPNAGHSIKPPYVPTTVTASVHAVSGGLFELGGTASGNAYANADSWPRIIAFLSEHLQM